MTAFRFFTSIDQFTTTSPFFLIREWTETSETVTPVPTYVKSQSCPASLCLSMSNTIRLISKGWLVLNPFNMPHGDKIIVIILACQWVIFLAESKMNDIFHATSEILKGKTKNQLLIFSSINYMALILYLLNIIQGWYLMCDSFYTKIKQFN